ncbi:unnamed protein product, partial [Sphacelaria rigidula]
FIHCHNQNVSPSLPPSQIIGTLHWRHTAVYTVQDMSAPLSLSERIEALDRETRSCWRRVDELEEEEASLANRLMGLEKVRRGERIEILMLEKACKTAEMAMLHAEQE